MTCCPHCGGDDGYFTLVKLSGRRYYGWDGSHEETQPDETLDESAPKCTECNQKVVVS